MSLDVDALWKIAMSSCPEGKRQRMGGVTDAEAKRYYEGVLERIYELAAGRLTEKGCALLGPNRGK
jgi:hypothetical protein